MDPLYLFARVVCTKDQRQRANDARANSEHVAALVSAIADLSDVLRTELHVMKEKD